MFATIKTFDPNQLRLNMSIFSSARVSLKLNFRLLSWKDLKDLINEITDLKRLWWPNGLCSFCWRFIWECRSRESISRNDTLDFRKNGLISPVRLRFINISPSRYGISKSKDSSEKLESISAIFKRRCLWIGFRFMMRDCWIRCDNVLVEKLFIPRNASNEDNYSCS